MEIKRANLDDLKAIQNLSAGLIQFEVDAFDPTKKPEWSFSEHGENYFKKMITDSDSIALVATVDSQVVGYLTGSAHDAVPWRDLNIVADLDNLFVIESYRNQRIGSALTAKFFEWCKEKKVDRVRVIVMAESNKAISFYEGFGFKGHELKMEATLEESK